LFPPKLFRELGFKVGAEIGVARGYFSKIICMQCPQIKLYSVDAWALWDGATHGETQETFENLYKSAVNRLSGFPNNQIVRDFSMNAVKRFADKSLDFVYIDAAHDYKAVTEDIREWSKKVRKGGIVAGDDYAFPQEMEGLGDFFDSNYSVKKAVNHWVKTKKIKPLFILNKEMPPTWMYVK
jgi:predicted O-methyltransferase YrrM